MKKPGPRLVDRSKSRHDPTWALKDVFARALGSYQLVTRTVQKNGATYYDDGSYTWPTWYRSILADHVRPPDVFAVHVMQMVGVKFVAVLGDTHRSGAEQANDVLLFLHGTLGKGLVVVTTSGSRVDKYVAKRCDELEIPVWVLPPNYPRLVQRCTSLVVLGSASFLHVNDAAEQQGKVVLCLC